MPIAATVEILTRRKERPPKKKGISKEKMEEKNGAGQRSIDWIGVVPWTFGSFRFIIIKKKINENSVNFIRFPIKSQQTERKILELKNDQTSCIQVQIR